jgi:hypothetical protein
MGKKPLTKRVYQPHDRQPPETWSHDNTRRFDFEPLWRSDMSDPLNRECIGAWVYDRRRGHVQAERRLCFCEGEQGLKDAREIVRLLNQNDQRKPNPVTNPGFE